MIVYHGTTARRARRICQEGFLPKKPSRRVWFAEGRTYAQIIPFTDRLDYLASMTANHGYVMAVEKLAGIEVPERGEYLRVIMDEFMRISNHLMAVGFIDPYCAPTTVFAAFNNLKGPKRIDCHPLIGHGAPKGWYEKSVNWLASQLGATDARR